MPEQRGVLAGDELAGLTSAEAGRRAARDGPNSLPSPARTPAWRRFLGQLTGVFAALLWSAAVLAWIAGLSELTVAISLVVLVNASFAFAQESRADHAADRLRSLLPARVTVRRDRVPRLIDAVDVVTGDVLVLEAGDRVPADARVLVAGGLLLDTSTLTGESEPTALEEGATVYAGTFVVEGTADAVVVATGPRTRLAGIARDTVSTSTHTTPLTRELRRVVRSIGAIAVATGAAFFALTMAIGRDLGEGFVLAIGVTVALVPEALLPTVTLALAWGAERMAHSNVLVRSLDAVETLGSTTFVCTDKTGTLTRNQMAVVQAWVPAGAARVAVAGYAPDAPVEISDPGARRELERLAQAGARCSRGYAEWAPDGGWRAHGDPMEAAIDAFARRLGLDTDLPRTRSHADRGFAFDPHRRRMSVLADGDVIAKGAPDAVLPLCLWARGDERARAEAAVAELSGRGLRVLAVAGRTGVEQIPAGLGRGGTGPDPVRARRPAGPPAHRRGPRARLVPGRRGRRGDDHG